MTQRSPYPIDAGTKALGGVYLYVRKSGLPKPLPKPLLDLVFPRASQLDGCASCSDLHGHDLPRQDTPAETLLLVSAWRGACAQVSGRKRGALA